MSDELEAALKLSSKQERNSAIYALSDRVVEELEARFP